MTLLDTNRVIKSHLKSNSVKPFAIRGTIYYTNYAHNIELNSHSLVQETGSRFTPYHRPCFTRQPRSTSFPPSPLENKSQQKKLFDVIQPVCISLYICPMFILAISFSRNSSALIRLPSLNHFLICQLSKMIKNKKAHIFTHSVLG